MKNYYKISFARLAVIHLANRIRNSVMIAYIMVMVKPLEDLQFQFLDYVRSVDTTVNSQVCYMRGMLNDEFDYHDRRIIVRTVKKDFDSLLTWDISILRRIIVHTKGSENYEPLLREKKGQIGKKLVDFEVVFPKGFSYTESELDRIKSKINSHMLASKKYNIVYE